MTKKSKKSHLSDWVALTFWVGMLCLMLYCILRHSVPIRETKYKMLPPDDEIKTIEFN
jgi:hypothetical protein